MGSVLVCVAVAGLCWIAGCADCGLVRPNPPLCIPSVMSIQVLVGCPQHVMIDVCFR